VVESRESVHITARGEDGSNVEVNSMRTERKYASPMQWCSQVENRAPELLSPNTSSSSYSAGPRVRFGGYIV